MISQETCEAIWHCQREINVGEQLLLDIAKERENANIPRSDAPQLKDAFGHKQGFQLGVPSGRDSQRLLNVAPKLAESIIRAHIATKKSELVALNERARVEVDLPIEQKTEYQAQAER